MNKLLLSMSCCLSGELSDNFWWWTAECVHVQDLFYWIRWSCCQIGSKVCMFCIFCLYMSDALWVLQNINCSCFCIIGLLCHAHCTLRFCLTYFSGANLGLGRVLKALWHNCQGLIYENVTQLTASCHWTNSEHRYQQFKVLIDGRMVYTSHRLMPVYSLAGDDANYVYA